jgi:hypothetical protein
VVVTGIASVPAAARAVDPLRDADYSYALEADTTGSDARSPEQWARAVFEDPSAAMRWFLLAGWRTVLGLRLGPLRSPDYVLGWHVRDRTVDSIVLEARSWFLTCYQVFWTSGSTLVYTTSVRYERKIGRVIWPPVSLVHGRTLPHLLRRAISGAVP